ncbi:MAG: serine/threonine-protein kinase HipA [Phenylobacterium sp.]|jgi:serine/threonine-protein kinase HipA
MRVMMMSGADISPTIKLFNQSQRVGTLVFSEPGQCTFSYDEQWRNHQFPISPWIGFDGQFEAQTVIRFLRNLFPEGEAFDLLLESHHLSNKNLYAILQTIGKDTAGALSFFDAEYQPDKTQLRLISDAELIAKLSSNSAAELVTWDGKYRLSVAGVQKKLNVYIDKQKQMLLADGEFSSTHILKFSSPRYKSIVINELFCMRLAKAVGLKVASTTFKSFGGHDALIVERFDRKRAAHGVKKRHMIDACQALDLPPEYKYENNFGSGRDVKHIRDGVSFKKLFAFAKTCAVPAVAMQHLLDWLIFNVVIGNSDAHGKNVSFFVSNSGITLTPFYDLVSVVFEASGNDKIDISAAMAIDDNFDINTITAFDLLSLADDSGIPFSLLKKRTVKLVTEVVKKVADVKFDDCELTDAQIQTIDKLETLIVVRAKALLKQSEHMNLVVREQF